MNMGAAKSPPTVWEWPLGDHADHSWADADLIPRAASADNSDSLSVTLSQLNLSVPEQDRVSPTTSLAVGTRASASVATSLGLSADRLTVRSLSAEALNASRLQFQPPSITEIDNTNSPISLRPHPGPTHIHVPRSAPSENSPLPHRNLGHQFVPSHLNSPRPLSLVVHTGPSMNMSAYHSDSALQVPTLHYGYSSAASTSQLYGDFVNHLSSSGITEQSMLSVRKGRGSKPKIKNELYKTEICRSYSMNNGYCKYGAKCQFAHGDQERRPVRRHPRYKTKLCRNYVTAGSCPYGNRCRFIHASDMDQDESNGMMNLMLAAQEDGGMFSYSNINTVNHQVASSTDSRSTDSPDNVRHLIQDLCNAPVNDISVDSVFALQNDLFQNPSQGNPIPSSIVHVPEAGSGNSGRVSPLGTFSFAGEDPNEVEPDSDKIALSPGSSQFRSRLPVFQELSSGTAGSDANNTNKN